MPLDRDSIAKRIFGMTPSDALSSLVCIRCHKFVGWDYAEWDQVDKDEYRITALCPSCYNHIMPPEDDK